jgi:LPS export ABC transporter protein LptC
MQRRTIKRLLIGVMVVTAVAVVAIFLIYRNLMQDPGNIMALVPEGEKVALGKVEHTATRDGKTEWHLEAASAQIMESEKQILFTDLIVVFYLEEGREVHLKADQGRLQTETNSIEVSGQVVVKDGNYQLTTEQLYYDHEQHRLTADVPVEISGGNATLVANSMAYDIDADRTYFDGNVKGIFSDQKAL